MSAFQLAVATEKAAHDSDQDAGGPCEREKTGRRDHESEQPPLLRQIEIARTIGRVSASCEVERAAHVRQRIDGIQSAGPHQNFEIVNADQAQNDSADE